MKGTLLEEDRTDAGGFVVVDRDNFRRKLSDQGEWLWLWPGPGEPEIVVPAWRMVSATLVRCGLGMHCCFGRKIEDRRHGLGLLLLTCAAHGLFPPHGLRPRGITKR